MKKQHLERLAATAIVLCLASAVPVAAEQESQAQQAAKQELETHLIQITILTARIEGANDLGRLPGNLRKALDDVRDFLPYGSFSVRASGLLNARRSGTLNLAGPDGEKYAVRMADIRPATNHDLYVSSFEVQCHRPGEGVSNLIRTDFTADVGETLVVGTSSEESDQEALLFLFTVVE